MFLPFTIGMIALGLYVGLLWVKARLSLRYARHEQQGVEEEGAVTLLQPILSGDPLLEASLRHNLAVLPLQTRYLWLIDEEDAAAYQITTALVGTTRAVVEVVRCPPVPPRTNPKVFKLQYALARVETPYVAVVDDDTLLASSSLAVGRYHLREATLFTGLPYHLPGTNRWSSLIAHFINNNSILTYLPLLHRREPLSLNGMFYLMRTETLRRMGGFTPILPYLCDDYALAKHVKQHGGCLVQGTIAHAVQTSVPDARAYLALMHRWFLFAQTLVFEQAPATRALLVVFLGLPSFLLWIGLLSFTYPLAGLSAYSIVLLMRHATIHHLHRTIFDKPVAFSFFTSVLAELLQPFHLLHALLQRRIRWRSRAIRVEQDGRFSYVQDHLP